MRTAPYTAFGKTLDVKVEIYIDGKYVDDELCWYDSLWVERGEDWYAFDNEKYRRKRIRVIQREEWLKALKRREDEIQTTITKSME